MTNHLLRKWRRSMLVGIITLIIFLGSIAANIIATVLQPSAESNMGLVWGILILGLLATIGSALWDSNSGMQSNESLNLAAVDHVQQFELQYLRKVATNLEWLPLRGMDLGAADPNGDGRTRRRLADIYIDLDTTTRFDSESKNAAILRNENEGRPLSVLEALARNQRIVLLGDPGGGKTTFVNHLAFCLACRHIEEDRKWLDKLKNWPPEWSNILPMPIVLRDVAAWFAENQPDPQGADLFAAYLAYWLHILKIDDYRPYLEQRLKQGRVLLLLDGLDEISVNDNILQNIKKMVNDLPSAYPIAPMLITCRILSYQDPRWRLETLESNNQKLFWTPFELAKLDEVKIDQFIDAWHRQLAEQYSIKNINELNDALHQAVRRRDLWRMAGNPLLLTMMALVHTHENELPNVRAELYEKVVHMLLYQWDAIRSGPGRNPLSKLLQEAELTLLELKQILWELAFHAHRKLTQDNNETESDESIADIGEAELTRSLARLYPDREQYPECGAAWVASMLQMIKLRAGLLVEFSEGVYRFPHRTFQEYLAGCYLSNQKEFVGQSLELARSGAFWRETILLAVGRQVYVEGKPEAALVLVSELVHESPPETNDSQGWRNVWLAGKIILEIGVSRVQRRTMGKELFERTRKQLVTLITTDRLTPRERVDAASVLSALGDPRDLAVFIMIPSGEFIMGSDKNEMEIYGKLLKQQLIDADINEEDAAAYASASMPQHTLYLPAFQISKYPVTNAQYARFVSMIGYEPPRHWRGKTPPPELYTHPVVNVTWHDAQAYCRWLSTQTKKVVRLPTEAEWERAARGIDGRLFPWGNNFKPEYCNMYETGIGTTSPVGIFSNGASPEYCMDMAGNVWEWTQSLWGGASWKPGFGYPYVFDEIRENVDAPDSEARVVRGGSFYDPRFDVRCAVRLKPNPMHQIENHGFRVVIPNPVSLH